MKNDIKNIFISQRKNLTILETKEFLKDVSNSNTFTNKLKFGNKIKNLVNHLKNQKILYVTIGIVCCEDGIIIYNKSKDLYFSKGYYEYDKNIWMWLPLVKKINNELWELLDKIINSEKYLEIEQKKLREEQKKLREKQRLLNLSVSQEKVISELDKDGDGKIDINDGSGDFMKLFRKHQSVIKEFDKDYINHLVKISNYLKIKRSNIQEIFLEIRKTENQSQLDENVGLLKNQIHTYDVVLYHSLTMITSIVEDDLITVNEIYEEFDKLKMFKTDHEKEVSQKLSDIGDGLSSLMYSINSMERNIVSGLNTLSYVTLDSFSDLNNSLSRELQSIDSSIQSNNLLNTIQTYQLYKINKQTKGLIQ